MFTQVLESMGKVTGATVSMQQEMFKKWIGMWPGVSGQPNFPQFNAEQAERFQKKWAETVSEQIRRQKEVIEAQFKTGMENIDKAFRIGEAKNPEEARAQAVELWRKCFDGLRQAYETQLRETQIAMEKWFELMTASFPPS